MSDTRHPESPSRTSRAKRHQAHVAALSRVSLIVAALRLSCFTIAWNGLFGASALAVAFVTGSIALAGITFLALLVTSAFGWWWADPVAALVIAIGLAAEGLRVAIRHRFG
jgi:hypothetical protein